MNVGGRVPMVEQPWCLREELCWNTGLPDNFQMVACMESPVLMARGASWGLRLPQPHLAPPRRPVPPHPYHRIMA